MPSRTKIMYQSQYLEITPIELDFIKCFMYKTNSQYCGG